MNGREGVPDLGSGRNMVAIRAYSVFHVAGVDALAATMPGLQGDVTLRVVDIPNAVAYLIPMTLPGAEKLIAQLGEAVQTVRGPQESKGEQT